MVELELATFIDGRKCVGYTNRDENGGFTVAGEISVERFECAKALAYLIPSITEGLGVLTEHMDEACADPFYRVALVAKATPYIECILRHVVLAKETP